MGSPEVVLYDKDGAVAVVTLNRPEVLNAYNVAMRDALFEILTAIRDDPEVHVVVLRGGGASFCSGGDLNEFGSAPSPTVARAVRWQRDVWGLFRSLPQVTIAAVHGQVAGGGFEIALWCDLCISAVDARFSYPETARGMIPGVAGTQTTPRAIGLGRAMELILTGRTITAAEAYDLGIVTRIVPRHQLLDTATDLAREIAIRSPTAIALTKRAVDEGFDLPLTAALNLERRLSARLTIGDRR